MSSGQIYGNYGWTYARPLIGVDFMVIIHISNPKISLDKLWNFDGLIFTTYHGIMVPDAPEIPWHKSIWGHLMVTGKIHRLLEAYYKRINKNVGIPFRPENLSVYGNLGIPVKVMTPFFSEFSNFYSGVRMRILPNISRPTRRVKTTNRNRQISIEHWAQSNLFTCPFKLPTKLPVD